MLKSLLSAASLTLLLSACASAPSVVQTCPVLPALAPLQPEPSLQERMQNFLQGKLPGQMQQ